MGHARAGALAARAKQIKLQRPRRATPGTLVSSRGLLPFLLLLDEHVWFSLPLKSRLLTTCSF